ncbi:adenosine deaminase [Inconstantimicrobium mannanitabidum]|uniref:Adenosine deaminase family protein n=1 Tax=Inconstantimicrobium mannanitabidum TaxID=1604901 RepID=A0ACB5RF66_9CLOT|nr:adenosine deaminase [Clostridium sp. TW13]GKX67599.1 adenosine deaminase family protein [Clostridium sp. TW13]
MNDKFEMYLQENSLKGLESIPKSDLHSHAGRGGSITYIEQLANVKITPPSEPFNSLKEMNQWLNDNVKCYCPGFSGYLKRVEAAFVQAKNDNIAVLALSFAIDEIDACGTIDNFISIMDGLHKKFAPETEFLPDLAVGYEPGEQSKLDEIFSANWFRGIDICNYSRCYSMNELKKICQKSRDSKLILKAHIGEFGGADDVMRYAEELELNQIQHGIAAANSPQIMKWLAKHKIQLNVCPTSNIMLRNSLNYQSHQIRKLFDFGVPVTINSDDLIIFNATVSQEYLNLYNAGLMTADELNTIRLTGLNEVNNYA